MNQKYVPESHDPIIESRNSEESSESETPSSTNGGTLKDVPSDLNPPMQRNVRKEGVISDRIEQKPDKEFQIDVFGKEQSTMDLIEEAIVANEFLNNMMDAERLKVVVQAMIPMELEANSFIIKEGEIGSHFYVSAAGTFEVVKDGEVKRKFGPGVVFGELAILYKARRFASIKVTADAKVWALERKIFQKIMMKTGSQEREQNIKFLSSVTVLKGVSPDVLHKIGDLLKRVRKINLDYTVVTNAFDVGVLRNRKHHHQAG